MDWAKALGGLPKYLGEYAKSFAAASFSRGADLYIASGLLSYNASAEMNNMLDFLRPYSRTVQVCISCSKQGMLGTKGRLPLLPLVVAAGMHPYASPHAATCLATRTHSPHSIHTPAPTLPSHAACTHAVQGAIPAPGDASHAQPGAAGAAGLLGAGQCGCVCGAGQQHLQRLPQVCMELCVGEGGLLTGVRAAVCANTCWVP